MIDELKNTNVADLNTFIEEFWSRYFNEIEKSLSKFNYEISNYLGGNHLEDLSRLSESINLYSDFDLYTKLKSHYNFNKFDFSNVNNGILICKINHGFWEHFSFLSSHSDSYDSFRSMKLKDVEFWYKTNDVLEMSFAPFAMNFSQLMSGFVPMLSATTGIQSFEKVFDLFAGINSSDHALKERRILPAHVRGAARGLILLKEFINSRMSSKLVQSVDVYDSYSINSSFENGIFFKEILKNASSNSLCLVIGPERISSFRIKGWPGMHAHYSISHMYAHRKWKFNLFVIEKIIKHYQSIFSDITILFQGGTLSSTLSAYLASSSHLDFTKLYFYDLGRLLDVVTSSDLTATGSPLPNGKSTVEWVYEGKRSERILEIFND